MFLSDSISQQSSLPLEGARGVGSPAQATPAGGRALVTSYLRNFKGDIDDDHEHDPAPGASFMAGEGLDTHQDRLTPGWEITAGGPRPRGCGDSKVMLFCETCGHWFRVDRTCHERTCPVCGVIWSYKQGANMAFRLVEVGRQPVARGAWGRHAVVSPPRDQWDRLLEDDSYVKYKRRQVADIARRCGFRGCAVVFHPYRDSEERGHYDVDGPHFHVVGWADKLVTLQEVAPRLQSGGWIFKGVARSSGRAHRLRSWAQFYKVCQYELSHCAIIPGAQAFTWYGICHWKVVPLGEKEKDFRKHATGHPCPSCSSIWTVPLELVRPDAEVERKPHIGHLGQTRFKTGDPLTFIRR